MNQTDQTAARNFLWITIAVLLLVVVVRLLYLHL
jgi:hypothetical protein